MSDEIIIRGAREHNLKNIDINLPRNKLICITGLSGSGKSSLAFDTIYAEGQRRYVESLSAYARQFLGQMEKPDVDSIEGLSPAISVDQKTTSKNPRSTVGTVTEIYDYLRLLFARVGHPHCPTCGREIGAQSIDQILDKIMLLEKDTRFLVLAPLVRHRKGEFLNLFEDLRRDGFSRVLVDGKLRNLDEDILLERYENHSIAVVVDRLKMRDGLRNRLADSVETALSSADGLVEIATLNDAGDVQEVEVYSERFSCPVCGTTLPELEPRIFSFNAPQGACEECQGLGTLREVDPDMIVVDETVSISEGSLAVSGIQWKGGYYDSLIKEVAKTFKIPLDVAWQDLSADNKHTMMFGPKKGKKNITVSYKGIRGRRRTYDTEFNGLVSYLTHRYRSTDSEGLRDRINELMSDQACPACQGARLKPEILAITINNVNISQITELSVEEAVEFFTTLTLSQQETLIGEKILKEIRERLGFLHNVGLSYLTLSRSARTLSGGESQRIRLASQIGSGLVACTYVLDEPSIGLAQRDNDKLIKTLTRLRDMGNTVIVVEHDEETMMIADMLIDIGPGSGVYGGEVVAQGTANQVMKNSRSLTGQYLSGKKRIEMPERKDRGEDCIKIVGARENNLKNIDVNIPVGLLTCVTGVSGSGKSSLINEILYKGAAHKLHHAKDKPGSHVRIEGLDHIDKIINIDQSPIGRTPRSNAATYTGAFDTIRQLFSKTQEARARGYKPGRFSFNVPAKNGGGRCEACRGEGTITVEMHFLPDIYVPCEVCHGTRYNSETLEIRYKGKNIHEVLSMSITEAVKFFDAVPVLKRKLGTLEATGLGYLAMNLPAPHLSGGEATRVKLATELSKVQTGKTLFILDEPSTGLHFEDISKLMDILVELRKKGNTVVVIEHNLDIAKCADWILDLGPEGGSGGGTLVACGTPEEVAACKESYTGIYLKPVLEKHHANVSAKKTLPKTPKVKITPKPRVASVARTKKK